MGSVRESSDQEDAEGFVFSVLFHHYLGRSYPFSSWLYFTIPCSSGPCSSLSHPLPIIPCPFSALSSCLPCSLLSCSSGPCCPSLPFSCLCLPCSCPCISCSGPCLPCSCYSCCPCLSCSTASV